MSASDEEKKGWGKEEVKGEDQVFVTGKRRELIGRCLGVDGDEEQLRCVTLDSFVPVGRTGSYEVQV